MVDGRHTVLQSSFSLARERSAVRTYPKPPVTRWGLKEAVTVSVLEMELKAFAKLVDTMGEHPASDIIGRLTQMAKLHQSDPLAQAFVRLINDRTRQVSLKEVPL